MKIIGVLLAFPAVYLTAHVRGDDNKPQNLLWPVLIFIGGGMLDTLMNYIQMNFLSDPTDQAVFTIFCFATAGSIGILLIGGKAIFKKKKIALKNIIAGICLGIPNYFSIYYFIRALNSGVLESSATIPVLNIGMLAVSVLTAILLFREHVNIYRILGLAMSILAILFIAFGDR